MSADGSKQHNRRLLWGACRRCLHRGVIRLLRIMYCQTTGSGLSDTKSRQYALPPLQVAEKLGVRSLRGQTLAASSDYMQLGVHSVEAFGQSEALTTRLRHIISDYSDGPGILMELLQNADDAGATEVAFLLDEESYPTSSILGGSSSVRCEFGGSVVRLTPPQRKGLILP